MENIKQKTLRIILFNFEYFEKEFLKWNIKYLLNNNLYYEYHISKWILHIEKEISNL